MRWILIFIILLTILLAGCATEANVGSITPPYIETGIDPNLWANIPAGEFPYSQHDHMTTVDYDYQIMITDVTNEQYSEYLNAALKTGDINVGDVDVESGDISETVNGVNGYYPGESFQGYKH